PLHPTPAALRTFLILRRNPMRSDGTFEAGMDRLSWHFRSTMGALHARYRALYGADPPKELLRSLLSDATPVLGESQKRVSDLDQGYLLYTRTTQEAWEYEQKRKAWLEGVCARMTYVGTSVVPQHWSLLGWLGDDPRWPVALSRDSGHVILISGTQG